MGSYRQDGVSDGFGLACVAQQNSEEVRGRSQQKWTSDRC